MARLLKIEFFKIKSYKAFWWLTGAYMVLFILVSLALGELAYQSTHDPTLTIFSFPNIWHNLSYIAGLFNLLLGIMLILLISNEFTFRTFRQNILEGLSREEAVLSKMLFTAAISAVFTFFLFGFGMVKGLSTGHFDYMGEIFQKIHFLPKLFLQMMGYMAVAALTAFLLKRAALAIVFFLAYVIIIERLIRLRIDDHIDRFLPMNLFGALIAFPGEFDMQLITGADGGPLHPLLVIALAITYIAAFWAANYVLIRRQDL